jgi:hypothetical protein
MRIFSPPTAVVILIAVRAAVTIKSPTVVATASPHPVGAPVGELH